MTAGWNEFQIYNPPAVTPISCILTSRGNVMSDLCWPDEAVGSETLSHVKTHKHTHCSHTQTSQSESLLIPAFIHLRFLFLFCHVKMVFSSSRTHFHQRQNQISFSSLAPHPCVVTDTTAVPLFSLSAQISICKTLKGQFLLPGRLKRIM